jgi:hypothetical protein
VLTLDATALAQVAAGHRGVAWLIELDFAGGTSRFTTWPYAVVSGSTYTALGVLADVKNVQESADTTNEQITLSLAVTNAAMFAAAMGDPTTYRGRAARLYLQLFSDTHQPAGAKVLRWQGYMSKLQISRTAAGMDGDGTQGRIEMICTRAGMARARNAEGLRLTDQQQQTRYPGDTGLRYVRTLIEHPALWLSKEFQKV